MKHFSVMAKMSLTIFLVRFLSQEHAEFCRRNQTVEEDIRNLVREKEELEKIIRDHHCSQKVQA